MLAYIDTIGIDPETEDMVKGDSSHIMEPSTTHSAHIIAFNFGFTNLEVDFCVYPFTLRISETVT